MMCKDFKGAVFLDRDGTISEEVGYITNLNQFQLMTKSAEAVKLMNERGLKVILITNQAGVAKGYFPEEMVNRVHKKMEKTLSDQGAFLDAIYYCPHHPEGVVETYRKKCECRKPASGLLRQASEEHGIDISSSYMVGDKMVDVECAHQIGVKGVLVLTGYGKDELKKIEGARIRRPEYVADDIFNAVKWIVNDLYVERNGDTNRKIECHR